METSKNGFTLVELLITVTIIGVLTAVAVVNFGGTNKKARDSRRMADLEKIRVALELNRQEKGVYPANAETALINNGYLQAWPKDPKSGFTYSYSIGTSYTYTLSAQMENLGSTNGSFGNYCGGVCNYQVVSP